MHTPLKNSAASNHGQPLVIPRSSTSTSHGIPRDPTPTHAQKFCRLQPWFNKYVPPHLAQPMHTTINTETDRYMIFSRTDGPKKRALVQKI